MPGGRLLPANHFLSVAIDYLFRNRTKWGAQAAVGKTLVCTQQMSDRIAAKLGRRLYEMRVGFKCFGEGLFDSSLGLGGEESVGATFLRTGGMVWTTGKDGLVPALRRAFAASNICAALPMMRRQLWTQH